MQRYLSASKDATLTTPVQVTVSNGFTDTFKKGDAVFQDYKTNSFMNFNTMWTALALTAGPATSGPAADSNATGLTVAYLADNTFITFASFGSAGSFNLICRRYSANGTVLAQKPLQVASANTVANLSCAVLTSGNVIVAWLSASSTVNYAILTPTLQIIATGSFSGNTLFYIQPITTGGIFALTSAGIEIVTAAGARSTLVALSGAAPAIQDEVNDNQTTLDTTQCAGVVNYAPIGISSNGYGVILYNTTTANYYQLNADGTQRGTTTTVASQGAQTVASLKYAKSQAVAGNIAWAQSLVSNTGAYGIVGDNGSIVLASTATTSICGANGSLKLLSDPNGNFVLCGTFSSNWIILYMGATGSPFSTFPKTLAAAGSQIARILRLSTGIAFLCYPALYNFSFVFIQTGGTFNAVASIYSFASGSSSNTMAALIKGDAVYGVATTGLAATTYNVSHVAFKLDNTGTAPFVNTLLANVQGDVGTANPLRFFLDPTGNFFVSMMDTVSNANCLFSIFDLSLNLLASYSATGNMANAKVFAKGYSFVVYDAATGAANGGAMKVVKPRSSVLLGVADADAVPGGPLLIDTKGILPTTWPAIGTFDQSSNNPPGNKGWFGQGICDFTGFN